MEDVVGFGLYADLTIEERKKRGVAKNNKTMTLDLKSYGV